MTLIDSADQARKRRGLGKVLTGKIFFKFRILDKMDFFVNQPSVDFLMSFNYFPTVVKVIFYQL